MFPTAARAFSPTTGRQQRCPRCCRTAEKITLKNREWKNAKAVWRASLPSCRLSFCFTFLIKIKILHHYKPFFMKKSPPGIYFHFSLTLSLMLYWKLTLKFYKGVCSCSVKTVPPSSQSRPFFRELKSLRAKNFLLLFLAGCINAVESRCSWLPSIYMTAASPALPCFFWQITPEYLTLSFFLIVLNLPLFIFWL